jgi:hypothetical protein
MTSPVSNGKIAGRAANPKSETRNQAVAVTCNFQPATCNQFRRSRFGCVFAVIATRVHPWSIALGHDQLCERRAVGLKQNPQAHKHCQSKTARLCRCGIEKLGEATWSSFVLKLGRPQTKMNKVRIIQGDQERKICLRVTDSRMTDMVVDSAVPADSN